VAIPAVLAYNAFVRMNRNLLAETEAFAQDVHVLLMTGSALNVELQDVQESTASVKAARVQEATA
jgi:biopolymer transport protein ExbB